MRLWTPDPLVIDDQTRPGVLPACYLRGQAREGRPLFVHTRTIHLKTRFGWIRIPRGYITDWGSIPRAATFVTLTDLEPLGPHAVGADGHDWRYSIGEPGKKAIADQTFREQMILDRVPAVRRETMYEAVRLFGGYGYAKAKTWWDTENFADPETGERVAPPFAREEAFDGARWGMRDRPDWNEAA